MKSREEAPASESNSEDSQQGGGSVFFLVSGLIVSLLVLAIGLSLQTPEARKAQASGTQNAITVQTLTAQRSESVLVSRSYSGIVEPRRLSDLAFQRGGLITQVLVQEGDVVTAGQVLAKLDARRLQLQKTSLESALADARKELDELKAITPQDAADIRRKLQQLRSDLNQLDQQFPVGQPTQPASQDFLARLNSVERRMKALEGAAGGESLRRQEKLVAELEGKLDDLDLELDEAELKAPYEGVISARRRDEGAVVSAGMPIFQIAEQGALTARIGVPARFAAKVAIGASFNATIGENSAKATVTARLPLLDRTSRTRTLVLLLENTTSAAPGDVVRIELENRLDEPGFWLPLTALTREARGLWSVYALESQSAGEPSIVSRRYIETLHVESERAYVRGGIDAGDLVIADGLHRVTPGQRVTPQDASSAFLDSALMRRAGPQ